MKTRNLFLCGCLLLAGLTRADAQYHMNLPYGLSLMSNRLLQNNNCGVGFAGFPDGGTVIKYDNNSGNCDFYTQDLSGVGAWDPSEPCLLYGESALVLMPPTSPIVYVPGTPQNPSLPLQSVALAPSGVIGLVPSPFYNFLARQAVGVGTFEDIVGRHPSTFGRCNVYRLDASSPFTLQNPCLNSSFATTLPVQPFFFQNNQWTPYPPLLGRYAPSGVGEGAIMKFRTTIPSGAASTAQSISGVALETPTGPAPAIVCRGGPYTLRIFGINLPPNAAYVRLSRPGCNFTSCTDFFDFPVTQPPLIDAGYYLLTAPPQVTIPSSGVFPWATMDARLLNSAHAVISTCPNFAGALRLKPQNCNSGAKLVVKLVGRSRVAPTVVNQFALYYKNVGNAAATSARFIIYCIPGSANVTVGPTVTVGSAAAASLSPCTGAGYQAVDVIVPAVPAAGTAGDSGYLVINLTATTVFAVGSTFTLQGKAFNAVTVQQDKDSLEVRVITSQDPNDKQGLPGIGAPHYITGTETLPYQVRFENLPAATAPAKVVTVTDKLDSEKVDLSTFRLGPIIFGSHIVTPPAGAMSYSTTVPYAVNGNPADDIIVQINASMNTMVDDANFGLVTWTLRSIDPMTGQPPLDPLRGFLPPNTSPPRGQGAVYFSVEPQSNLIGGDTIANGARIIFDNNPFIDTPVWVNTIDTTEAVLTINKQGNMAVVTWTGYGTLQSTADLLGEWDDVPEAISPYIENATGQKFFRLRQ